MGKARNRIVARVGAPHGTKPCGAFFICALVAVTSSRDARALPPADDYLNPQKPGTRLVLTPFFGPGFRAAFDQRIELEREVTELRLQLTGTLAYPFAEASASVDARFFLMS